MNLQAMQLPCTKDEEPITSEMTQHKGMDLTEGKEPITPSSRTSKLNIWLTIPIPQWYAA
jgi:hypothetical protein